ncbi:hypothetical protein SPRG_12483 [Saprolegnia parasitica CBS 223.65]|uniref:ABC transporter domain-containing protein n=1 Tax=Saprolegnia parasitica (strain CBS 223.65) TaxID=695850 RepID=A0A067BSL1_SAPPC|nr:hypothetical protein SPRG_12483 [Saprolegnia parasitica CBS 223.65]KDO21519.1 hypothetical protein SPRG_12483 [Saprolegnia parasitica CBS 223.65]|eukprot:XP_012207786.1 hypothetical protein SPRG_12483 [Saprolegnia parasitica CBS 223.65]
MTHLGPLLRKNLALKRRHPIAVFFEIVLPTVFLILLSLLKSNFDSGEPIKVTKPGYDDRTLFDGHSAREPPVQALLYNWYSEGSAYSYSYDTTLLSQECKNHLLLSAPAPSLACRPPQLAIVPDTAFTRKYFFGALKQWYPSVKVPLATDGSVTLPGLSDTSVVFFPSETALEAYIQGSNYGNQTDANGAALNANSYDPIVAAAVVFSDAPTDAAIGTPVSLNYNLRFPVNNYGDGASAVPTTTTSYVPYRTFVSSTARNTYTERGFFTLQTLVTRFATCRPDWHAANQTTTGRCQQSAAVGPASLDATNKDVWVHALSSLRQSGKPVVAQDWSSLPSTTTASLLAPLRLQPQPHVLSAGYDMPGRGITEQWFLGGDRSTMPMFLPVTFLLFSVLVFGRLVTSLVLEKETRAKSYMQALGLSPTALVVSWYMTYGVVLFLGALLQMGVGCWTLFTFSSPLVLLLLYVCFGLACIAFGYFLSSLFASAKTGANIAQLVFLLCAGVSLAFNDNSSATIKAVASLLPPTAFTFSMQVIMQAEYIATGISLGAIGSFEHRQYSLRTGFCMLLADFVLFTLLGAYVEQLNDGHPWNFPITKRYWTSAATGATASHTKTTTANRNMEAVDAQLQAQEADGRALQVLGLRKAFGKGKVAVDDLHMAMYEGQITCLLGHNGAGKTTTISMLTGMLRPTSGSASFRHLDLGNDLAALRKYLGVCPQHDILYDDLTVREHLSFYASIKGHFDMAVVDAMLDDVGLTDKAHVQASALSGGMKRKLSVGIALIGGSALVFLDEPSSGMDPYSRRSMWDLLLRNRAGRVMILTTHYMEEADVLGDRIAIMADGALRCVGSSLFLKNRFGAGYTLTLVKAHADVDISDLEHLVHAFVPSATLHSNVAAEVAFQLPTDHASAFPGLFRALDTQMADVGVTSYGVSVTTLEDVFINVTTATATTGDIVVPILEDSGVPSDRETAPTVVAGRRSQVMALLKKRFHVAKRDKKALFIAVLLPALLLATGFGTMKLIYASTLEAAEPRLPLLTTEYPVRAAPYYCLSDVNSGCTRVFSSFSGATTKRVSTFSTPLFSSSSPDVFSVTYSPPSFNVSSVNATVLRFAQALLDGTAMQAQMGAYIVTADTNVFSYSIFANSSGDHASAIYKVQMDQALLRSLAGTNDISLTVASYPLPASRTEAARRKAHKAQWGQTIGFTANLFFLTAFAVFPGAAMTFLVKEKQLTAKHQQLVSGVKVHLFWAANYVWDLGSYLVLFVLALAMIQAFGVTAFQNSASTVAHAFTAVVVIFGLLGFALVPLTYLVSFLLQEHASAQNTAILFHLATGLILFIVHLLMKTMLDTDLSPGFCLFPLFAAGHALDKISTAKNVTAVAADGSPTLVRAEAFDSAVAGNDMLYLAATAVIFTILVLVVEYVSTKSLHKKNASAKAAVTTPVLNVDVQAEHDRIVYSNGFLAVQDLSVGLPKGECFGFLGINGAGKSTTLKMLMGQVAPSAGAAYLAGYDVYSQQTESRSLVGYCPQFDALFDTMTVREHLELYAALRGLDVASASTAVTSLLHKLHLQPFEHVLAGDLSGGNKRKTSVAIAMIGSPPIIILDEPSTGMDPVSRRFMWELISDISTTQRESTVILTTHSMEECEALCSRVGIMVSGQLECLGSIQHLKHRFGNGLVLDIKQHLPTASEVEMLVNTLPPSLSWADVEAACTRLKQPHRMAFVDHDHDTGRLVALALEADGAIGAETFASWWLVEDQHDALLAQLASVHGRFSVLSRQGTFARIQVHVSLAQIFGVIEDAKATLRVAEYSVAQTSLETIFNQFASKQKKEDDRVLTKKGCCRRRRKTPGVTSNYVAVTGP